MGARKYGCLVEERDDRDHHFPRRLTAKQLPDVHDFSGRCPRAYNQKTLGSCTAHSAAGGLHFTELEQDPESVIEPARLFIYEMTLMLQGTPGQDVGSTNRDTLKALAKYGYCPEKLYPYLVKNFGHGGPDKAVRDAAAKQRMMQLWYGRVNVTVDDICAAIAEDWPVTLGMPVYESFESRDTARTGKVVMPKDGERMLGGHSMLVVGYNRLKRVFIVRNSWDYTWGRNGYCEIPFEFALKYFRDLWAYKRVADAMNPLKS